MELNMNDKKPILVPAHLINPLAGTYIPSRDNPPAPVRPGAEDNKLHKSLEDKGTVATYRRHHP
jgi:hypothetical protein